MAILHKKTHYSSANAVFESILPSLEKFVLPSLEKFVLPSLEKFVLPSLKKFVFYLKDAGQCADQS